jgi:3-dehydroquinate synthase
LKEIISKCIKIKSKIVEKDEKEEGERKILNYGHTIGHAIEKISKFKIQHGEAVSIGMSLINTIAVNKKWFNKQDCDFIKNLLKIFKLPIKLEKTIKINRVLTVLKIDKKTEKGKPIFVIPKKLGKVFITQKITPRDILKAWKKHI